jgi:hypothetical protein
MESRIETRGLLMMIQPSLAYVTSHFAKLKSPIKHDKF